MQTLKNKKIEKKKLRHKKKNVRVLLFQIVGQAAK